MKTGPEKLWKNGTAIKQKVDNNIGWEQVGRMTRGHST